ncbi:MAG: N-acetylmuramoyl-L-alanine amidase [Kiritimatiellae bacterium]|nr:N-acetylmuramoyl-L-alanine amidase [Kiritimatiellia bacterium]
MRVSFLPFVTLLFPLHLAFAQSPDVGGNAPFRVVRHVQAAVGCTNYLWTGSQLSFTSSVHSLVFYPGRKRCDVDGVTVWLNTEPTGSVNDATWQMAGIDLDLLNIGLLKPVPAAKRRPLTVLIDPGHGGTDSGALSTDGLMYEKDLTLAVARRVGNLLATNGFHVCYTRTNDVEVSLQDRVLLATRTKADFFVSLHANHAGNPQASGVETYVLPSSGYGGTPDGSRIRGWQVGNRNDYANLLLGYWIQRNLCSMACTDRGVKRQSYYVLRGTACPAVLIEIGFLSNPTEASSMRTALWRNVCARSIASGICDYAARADSLAGLVALKRQADQEANERWRKKLAEKAKGDTVEKTTPPASVTDGTAADLPEEEPPTH